MTYPDDLFHNIFCVIFLAGVRIKEALRRRIFAEDGRALRVCAIHSKLSEGNQPNEDRFFTPGAWMRFPPSYDLESLLKPQPTKWKKRLQLEIWPQRPMYFAAASHCHTPRGAGEGVAHSMGGGVWLWSLFGWWPAGGWHLWGGGPPKPKVSLLAKPLELQYYFATSRLFQRQRSNMLTCLAFVAVCGSCCGLARQVGSFQKPPFQGVLCLS